MKLQAHTSQFKNFGTTRFNVFYNVVKLSLPVNLLANPYSIFYFIFFYCLSIQNAEFYQKKKFRMLKPIVYMKLNKLNGSQRKSKFHVNQKNKLNRMPIKDIASSHKIFRLGVFFPFK